jgi:hypothetical protein
VRANALSDGAPDLRGLLLVAAEPGRMQRLLSPPPGRDANRPVRTRTPGGVGGAGVSPALPDQSGYARRDYGVTGEIVAVKSVWPWWVIVPVAETGPRTTGLMPLQLPFGQPTSSLAPSQAA